MKRCWPWAHDWRLECSTNDPFYETTNFLYKCRNCEEVKIKEVSGLWEVNDPKRNIESEKAVEMYERSKEKDGRD